MQIQNRYQKEIDRLEKENKDLRKQLILKEQKSGNRKRRMKVRRLKSKFSNKLCLKLLFAGKMYGE